MMVEVTDADREAAASVAVLAEMRELILSGRADHHAEPWALHRQRGKLEGARLALEAAGRENLMICLTNCEELTDEAMEALNFAADRIRALDPAKIVGEV